MTKLKYPLIVLLVAAVTICIKVLYSKDTGTPTPYEYTADSLGNLRAIESAATISPPPVVMLSSDDSVYRWDQNSFDFRPVRPFDPLKDRPKTGQQKNPGGHANPPIVLSWETLINIEYRSEYFEEMGMDLYSPVFTKALEELDGKWVEITGYVIPVVEDGTEIALSQNPYAACFFCGKASPASVMSVSFAKPIRRLRTDDYKTFSGRLKLNYDDPNQFYYILEEAQMQ